MNDVKIIFIAMACHEANRSWCRINGDDSQKPWEEAEKWQRESAIQGVKFRMDNPHAGKDSQHNAWMDSKIKDGWVYGEVKDAEKKTHPCLVPFDELPEFQKTKDELFCAICDIMLSDKKNFNPETVGTGKPIIESMGLGALVTNRPLLDALNEGKRIQLKGQKWFVFKQVPSTVPANIIPKMSSLPPKVKKLLSERNNELVYKDQYCSVQPDGTIRGFSINLIENEDNWIILD